MFGLVAEFGIRRELDEAVLERVVRLPFIGERQQTKSILPEVIVFVFLFDGQRGVDISRIAVKGNYPVRSDWCFLRQFFRLLLIGFAEAFWGLIFYRFLGDFLGKSEK